jgi:hypothetical protein
MECELLVSTCFLEVGHRQLLQKIQKWRKDYLASLNLVLM